MNNTAIATAIRNLISKGTKGATFAILTTETESKSFMNKGRGANANPHFGKVVKRSFLNVCIGFDYGNGVNRLAVKEGKEERETQERSWGTISEDRIFIDHHEPASHLRTRVMGTMQAPIFVNVETGEEVEKSELEPWLKASKKSSTQADLEGEVVERDYKLESIRTIKTNGETLDFTSTIQDFSELVEGVTV
jgi:hypothetical protein